MTPKERAAAAAAAAAVDAAAERLYKQGPWAGLCYVVAARFVTDEPLPRDVCLVHGEPLGIGGAARGKRYGHAWVEVGGMVYDLTVSATPFMRQPYYALGSIKEWEVRRYTAMEAKEALDGYQHWGPWT